MIARDEKKNLQTVLRSRSEHVTEMILEHITDFTEELFETGYEDVPVMSLEQTIEKAIEIEENAERFYVKAAEKLNALREVSRIFERLAKRHVSHRERLKAMLKNQLNNGKL